MYQNLWIIIPAYNESNQIGKILGHLVNDFKNIVVIDDGSTDNTFQLASEFNIHVIRHPINSGQGAALKTGLRYAVSKKGQFFVTFDADGQHDPSNIKTMYQYITKSSVDIILGSRFLGTSQGITKLKKIILELALLYTKITTRLNITDTHNGIRMFNLKVATGLKFEHSRMAHASEILEQISKNKWSYTELPVNILYTSYSIKKGQSFLDVFRIMFELLIQKFIK